MRWQGIFIVSLVLVLDQYTKLYIQTHLNLPIYITPFFNLISVWNKGISFGLFGSYLWANTVFIITSLVIIGLLYKLCQKMVSLTSKIAFYIIVGGAFGNIIDRLKFGAVFDFLDFHLFNYHFPTFNIADSSICIGAFILLYNLPTKSLS